MTMNRQTDPQSPPVPGGIRGFIYFCEDGLHYVGGIRAWIFFVPYLFGVALLEPHRPDANPHADLLDWAIFLLYLVGFPMLWRAILIRLTRWTKKNDVRSRTSPS
jgi:hypothetical protein